MSFTIPPQRVAAVLLAAAGLGACTSAITTEVDDYALSHHGTHTTATVREVHQDRKVIHGLVTFPLRDGTVASRRLKLSAGDRVGSGMDVVYDPADPSTVRDERDLQTSQWFTAVLLLPLGAVLLWAARRAWHSTSARWNLRPMVRGRTAA